MLVPDNRPHPLGCEERIDDPGATTSGFSRSEMGVGPAAEKPAIDGGRRRGRGAHRDRVGRASGRADRPTAEVLEVVACGDDGHDARGGRSVERERDDVARGLDLGLTE